MSGVYVELLLATRLPRNDPETRHYHFLGRTTRNWSHHRRSARPFVPFTAVDATEQSAPQSSLSPPPPLHPTPPGQIREDVANLFCFSTSPIHAAADSFFSRSSGAKAETHGTTNSTKKNLHRTFLRWLENFIIFPLLKNMSARTKLEK